MNPYLKAYMEKEFDAGKEAERVIGWIRDWFAKNGPDSPAVIGLSGGKDSTLVAALCVKALGKDRVFGVLMPDHAGGKGYCRVVTDSLCHCGYRGSDRWIKEVLKGSSSFGNRMYSGRPGVCARDGNAYEYSATDPDDDTLCGGPVDERQSFQ